MTETLKRAKPQWERDLEAWTEANRAKILAEFVPNRTVAQQGKPDARVSDLLRVAREARQRPEIWDSFLSLRDRLEGDPEASVSNEVIHLCGSFSRWYRIRNGLDDALYSYALVPGLLYKYALGEIDEQDDAAAKVWLLQFSIARDDQDSR